MELFLRAEPELFSAAAAAYEEYRQVISRRSGDNGSLRRAVHDRKAGAIQMGKTRFANMSRRFARDSARFPEEPVTFIRDSLRDLGIPRKIALKTELMAEENISTRSPAPLSTCRSGAFWGIPASL